ncbi:MAG: M2 family metallopeptidase, partial [Bryobacteraceae bacterium]
MLLISLLTAWLVAGAPPPPTASQAREFMDQAEAELLQLASRAQQAAWVEENFITGDTEAIAARQNERLIARTTELVEQAKPFEALPLAPELARKFKLLKLNLTLPAPADAQLRGELTRIASSLEASYGSGKYCPGPNETNCLGIYELDVRMAQSRDSKELEKLWTGWHKIGAPMRERYARFVDLSNQGARELGFPDTGAMWRSNYDASPEAFSADLERLWQEVKPLYL